MLNIPGVTQRLAELVADTQWDNLPAPAARQAKRSLLNFFAVALTGCRTATFEAALASQLDNSENNAKLAALAVPRH